MRHMKDMRLKDVASYVSYQLRKEPPVFWKLLLTGGDLGRYEEIGLGRRRPDSNTLEIIVRRSAEPEDRTLEDELYGLVRSYASDEDERNIHAAEGPLPSGVAFELESEVPVAEGSRVPMLPVIGPGGRATAFRGAGGMTGVDVTIRKRGGGDRGEWRRIPEIMRPLKRALRESFMGMDGELALRAEFGYFELSKYEAQSLMRPVCMFAIEQQQDTEGRWPGYQQIVVSPATTARNLDDADGLGMWAESPQCSG